MNNECTTNEQRVNTNNNETNNIYNNIPYTQEQIAKAMFGKRVD